MCAVLKLLFLCSDIKIQYQIYTLYTNIKYNELMWYATRYILWHWRPFKHQNPIVASSLWQILISCDNIWFVSRWRTTLYNTKSVRKKQNCNINPNSTFTNTVVTTTVGFSDLNFKWQLKNDGKASALSELLPYLNMTHGSDWHRYVARVHQNSSIGTLYTMACGHDS